MSDRTQAALAAALLQAVPEPEAAGALVAHEPRLGGPLDLSCGTLPEDAALAMLAGPDHCAVTAAAHVSDRDVCLAFAADDRPDVLRALVESARTHPDALLEVARRLARPDPPVGSALDRFSTADLPVGLCASNSKGLALALVRVMPAGLWLEQLAPGWRLVDFDARVVSVLAGRACGGVDAGDARRLLVEAPAEIAGAVIASTVESRCDLDRDEARRLCAHRWDEVLSWALHWCSHIDAATARWAVQSPGAFLQPGLEHLNPSTAAAVKASQYASGRASRSAGGQPAPCAVSAFDADATAVVCETVRAKRDSSEPEDREHAAALVAWAIRGTHTAERLGEIQEAALGADGPHGLVWLDLTFARAAAGAELPDELFGPAAAWLTSQDVSKPASSVVAAKAAWELLRGPARFDPVVRVALAKLLDPQHTVWWLNGVTEANMPGHGEAASVLAAKMGFDPDFGGRDHKAEMGRQTVEWLSDAYGWVYAPWRGELLEMCGEALFDHLAGAGAAVGTRVPSAVADAAAAHMAETLGADRRAWHTALAMAEHWHASLPALCDAVGALDAEAA